MTEEKTIDEEYKYLSGDFLNSEYRMSKITVEYGEHMENKYDEFTKGNIPEKTLDEEYQNFIEIAKKISEKDFLRYSNIPERAFEKFKSCDYFSPINLEKVIEIVLDDTLDEMEEDDR